jgi:hypothetical protein
MAAVPSGPSLDSTPHYTQIKKLKKKYRPLPLNGAEGVEANATTDPIFMNSIIIYEKANHTETSTCTAVFTFLITFFNNIFR